MCFTAKSANGQFIIALPQRVSADQIAIDMHIVSAHPLTLTPFGYGPPVMLNSFSDTVHAGDQRLVAALQGSPVRSIGFSYLSPNANFCIKSLQVAAVGVVSPANSDLCQKVNIYGLPVGSREPCVDWL